MTNPKNFDINRQLVYNAVRCLNCNEVLVSYHRHDYKTCKCENHSMVDGGNDYQRYGGVDLEKVETIFYFADDDFEIVRKYAHRGGRGKDGTQPLKWVPICEMNDNWLNAVLDYGGAEWHLDLIKKEIQYRKDHNITIKEDE
jgi:hypothetical protein